MSENRFSGKTAVVTGAASGIGAAIATRLVAEGANVVGIDIAEQALDTMATTLGTAFAPHRADVAQEAQVAAALDAGAERFGSIDLAFNVAGASRVAPIVDLDEKDWDFTVDLVQKGVFLCTKSMSHVESFLKQVSAAASCRKPVKCSAWRS
ncbi:SDR family NAD(P)-dependent oxidoreductase [Rhodococcus indonesiensis]|uniref:SDR family NAD(P)-dependent oxidoreductase n=1 Tax=Rhodococcus indonesiensis TaxID=3055869 RepID=UPI0039F73C58